MADPVTPKIYIVSDGRGETCRQVIDAALVQFGGAHCDTVRCADVRTRERIEEIASTAARDGGVIFYTLVSPETRQAMQRASRQRFVPTVDILGPALSALDDLFGSAPGGTPGLLYETNRDRFDRIEAMHFTLRHDDGQRTHELDLADVVLVGVSRSSKTSTCFYLAYAGVLAANIPLIPGVEPPPELLKLPAEKVIGLRITSARLMALRQSRLSTLGRAELGEYRDQRTIARELIEAGRLMKEQGWRSIDVSYRAVEEIASQVMDMRGLKRRR
jgi:regulator of PEP synthase PpsR (kinase-PPPase family)